MRFYKLEKLFFQTIFRHRVDQIAVGKLIVVLSVLRIDIKLKKGCGNVPEWHWCAQRGTVVAYSSE
jgi:hypothetical protein